MHYASFGPTSIALIGVLTVAAAVMQYRRGDRWLLVTSLLLPAGVMLGFYADDHHHRVLGLPALVLIVAYPVLTRAGRRRLDGRGRRV